MSQREALIIDDNAKNASVLARMLSNEGMPSAQVLNPALLDSTLKQSDHFDVVFLDLEMPDIDGYQVLEQLRSDSRFQAIPIVAYTVHVSEIHAAHEQGFDGFLGKPLDSDRFSDQLARILNGEPVWETP